MVGDEKIESADRPAHEFADGSLQGKRHKPAPEILKGLDALVYDLPGHGLPFLHVHQHDGRDGWQA